MWRNAHCYDVANGRNLRILFISSDLHRTSLCGAAVCFLSGREFTSEEEGFECEGDHFRVGIILRTVSAVVTTALFSPLCGRIAGTAPADATVNEEHLRASYELEGRFIRGEQREGRIYRRAVRFWGQVREQVEEWKLSGERIFSSLI